MVLGACTRHRFRLSCFCFLLQIPLIKGGYLFWGMSFAINLTHFFLIFLYAWWITGRCMHLFLCLNIFCPYWAATLERDRKRRRGWHAPKEVNDKNLGLAGLSHPNRFFPFTFHPSACYEKTLVFGFILCFSDVRGYAASSFIYTDGSPDCYRELIRVLAERPRPRGKEPNTCRGPDFVIVMLMPWICVGAAGRSSSTEHTVLRTTIDPERDI